MSGNTVFFIVLALVAGIMVPLQGAVNNKLAGALESPILASFISFVIGTLSLLVFVIVSGTGFSGLASAKNASAVAWTGGLLGAFFVTASVVSIPKLGVALTFSLIVASQMLVTIIIDHYGLLDVPVKEASLPRIAGVLLIIVGVVLIRRY
ncbi:MAG: DMT family transporter [Acidobacteria bacterium]|nr:DMT family transporter [Acidobacteriota bacterium]